MARSGGYRLPRRPFPPDVAVADGTEAVPTAGFRSGAVCSAGDSSADELVGSALDVASAADCALSAGDAPAVGDDRAVAADGTAGGDESVSDGAAVPADQASGGDPPPWATGVRRFRRGASPAISTDPTNPRITA
jgi:hypothetical protein